MFASRTNFYLDKQNAKLFGVCAGIADYTGINVLWVRLAILMGAIMGGGMPLIPLYILVAWLAPSKPLTLYADDDEAQFWQKVRSNPSVSTREVKSRFRDIDHRLADIERFYTSTNRQLADEIDNLR